jgi:hypothetical protein
VSIYSVRLVGGQNKIAAPLTYTVPSSHTAVVRDVELYNGTASPMQCFIGIYVAGSLHGVFAAQASIAVNTAFQWQGRVVLESGDQVIVNAGADNLYAYLSGYDLAP